MLGSSKDLRYALFALACAAVGVLLRAPMLKSGFAIDDYAQLAMLDGTYPVPREPWDLYNFSDGTAEEADTLRHKGFFPWFTHREIRLSMFRPLASALVALDHQLFGDDALPFHIHSALWWVGSVLAVAWLFAAFLPRGVAYLALALFAVDESHTLPFGWIANRCSVGSLFFGTLGLIAYVRYRERGGAVLPAACALCFTLAVAFGEYGLSFAPYVAAYELWRLLREREPRAPLLPALTRHALVMWPAALPCIAYLALRRALERGPLHSGVYVGPDGDPAGFAWLLLQRVPVLFADVFAGIRSDSWNVGNLMVHPWVAQGLLDASWLHEPGPWRRAHTAVGVVTIVIALIGWRIVSRRLDRDAARPDGERVASLRWLAWGSALSILPVVGSFPSSRLMSIAEIGMAAVLAASVVWCLRDFAARFKAARVRTLLAGIAGTAVLVLHLVVAAHASYQESVNVKYTSMAIRKRNLTIEADKKRLHLQRVVILSALEYGTSLYVPFVLARHGRKPPRSCWPISLSPGPHVLIRDTERSFRFAPDAGYQLMANAPEELFRDPNVPFKRGDVVDLGGLTITVLETNGKHIQLIRVEADVPLDDRTLLFVVAGPSGLRRFDMPPVGGLARLPPPTLPML